MAKKNKILLLFILFANILQAQVSEYEYKAAFIERFTRFTEWPNENEHNIIGDSFEIVVLGDNPFNSSLDELFDDVKIKGKQVTINYTNNITEATNANLLFISKSEKKRINEILSVIDEIPMLIISDTKGFCKSGTHINMYLEGNYIRYEINEEAIKKSGLEVNSMLLSSAKIIKTDD